jgi:prepilin-type N-terminal cleavage/methylation domain-containing protein
MFTRRGFTLLEVLIVLAIIGILSSSLVYYHHSSENAPVPVKQIVLESPKLSTSATPAVTSTPAVEAENDKFITSLPVDLTKIGQISKFRSCAGHDSSGQDIEGILESNRSMKHYFYLTPALASTDIQLNLYAPFDGSVTSFSPENGGQLGTQMLLQPKNSSWQMTVFHTDPAAGIKEGSVFVAGQLLGYTRKNGESFDLALSKKDPKAASETEQKMDPAKFQALSQAERDQLGKNYNKNVIFDSLFNHLNSATAQQFAAKGVTVQTIIVDRATRDADPCNFTNAPQNSTDWVVL